MVLVQSKSASGADVKSPAFRAAIADVQKRLAAEPNVTKISTPLRGGGAVSKDGRSALVTFEIRGSPDTAADRIDPIIEAVDAAAKSSPGYRVEQFGDASANKALNEVFSEDLQKAETLSLPITLLILVFAFGSLVAAGVPLLMGISAVMATFGLIALPSQLLPVDQDVASVILLIGLAVGVDYSLFYLRREREERAAGRAPREALQTAAATSGRAVLISGLTVMAAMGGLLLTGDPTFTSFGLGTMLVVGVAMVGSLTVLPATLSLLGDRVEKGRIPFIGSAARAGQREGRIWSAIIDRVLRRPVMSLVVSAGVLIALAIPALGMNMQVSGTDQLPRSIPVVKTYDRIQERSQARPCRLR